MRKPIIFIASAHEDKDLAALVAQHLSDAGFEAWRWWETLRPGDMTLERLQEVARTVDGAVFICLGTDRTRFRGESVDAPRDNVLLELGLFLQTVGSKRAIIVVSQGLKLPSDLKGLTYLVVGDDKQTTAERVTAHFQSEFQRTPARVMSGPFAFPIEVDPAVAEASLRRPVPRGWHQRSLYLGTEGARNWLAVSEEPTYLTAIDQDQIRNLILQSVKGLKIKSFISLGPGNGETDREIAISLDDSTIGYFPVDISDGLLFHACSVLGEHLRLPLGILSDFEERMPFIQQRLIDKIERPVLVGLLGNTFCNLDRFEATFMHQIQNLLQPGDHVLLHVAAAADNWEAQQAQLSSHEHTIPRRRFFAQGLARQLNIPLELVLNEYKDRVVHREGRSDIPQAISVDFIDVTTGTRIQNVRWYRWEPFLEWLKSSFRFKISKEYLYFYGRQERGEGVVLLERC
jgi:SAM-dependent methyltransferase